MMAKDKINLRPYVHDRVDRLASLVDKPTSEFTMEDVHSIRVDIKQLRTLLQYLHASDASFPYAATYKPFRTLFKQAGTFRELQLQLYFLKPYAREPILQDYFRVVRQEAEVEMIAFILHLTSNWKKSLKKARKKTDPWLKRLDTTQAAKHLNQQRKQIRKILTSGTLARKDVHALRRNIKQLYYLEKAFHLHNPQSKTADDFQELLGEWHDHVVIAGDLKSDMRKHRSNPALAAKLKQIRKLIQARENDLFRRIMQDRKAYLNAITLR